MRHREPRWLLCGGIGSGKSAVRSLLADHGVRTIDADAVGHLVLDGEGFEAVARRWPEVVLEGKVDRKALAEVVFGDAAELAALEAITHPLIIGRIRAELEDFTGVAVIEMPLPDIGLGWPMMVVDARDETRIDRAVARGLDRADVERRMAAQPSRAEWLAAADLVIPNHGSLDELEETVTRLLPELIA